MKLYINDVNNLYEQDVEIEVKHEGILEVPEGKNVDDLPMSHFEKLAKKKGLGKITKALNNLQVWNKNDDPKLSKWAGDMIDKLNKKLGKEDKKESLRSIRESLDFEVVHESDDDEGNPTLWGATVNSRRYGRYLWIELSNDGQYDLLYNAGGDRYSTIKSFRSFNRAKRFADDLIRQEKSGYDESFTVEAKRGRKPKASTENSVARFLDLQIEQGKIDEKQVVAVYGKNNNLMWLGKAGFYPLYMQDIRYQSSGYDADHPHELWINARSYTTPFDEGCHGRKRKSKKSIKKEAFSTEEYFVGASREKPMQYDGDNFLYDEIFTFKNDEMGAWEEAIKWNMRGYYVTWEKMIDGEVVDSKLYRPRELGNASYI